VKSAKAPNHGIGAVSIDGGAESDIDYYQANRQEQVLCYTSPALAAGQRIMCRWIRWRLVIEGEEK
jgi:hypothetical protein